VRKAVKDDVSEETTKAIRGYGFVQTLCWARTHRKLSVEDLSSMSGITVGLIRKIESGQYSCEGDVLVALAKALRMRKGKIASGWPRPLYNNGIYAKAISK
jgi:ribosome-binding protein aMBF1 (putative translation factor)